MQKAVDSFFDRFDEFNLAQANQELQDTIEVAQLNPIEKSRFLEKVKKELQNQHLSLDYFSTAY